MADPNGTCLAAARGGGNPAPPPPPRTAGHAWAAAAAGAAAMAALAAGALVALQHKGYVEWAAPPAATFYHQLPHAEQQPLLPAVMERDGTMHATLSEANLEEAAAGATPQAAGASTAAADIDAAHEAAWHDATP